jgi:hypothetical protein
MRLRVSNPALIPDLLKFLRSRVDVVAEEVSDDEVDVGTGAPVLVASTVLDEAGIEDEAAEVDVPKGADVPPGEWRSLTQDLLATLYSPPR